MAETDTGTDHSDGAEDQGSEGADGADEFGDAFAEDEEGAGTGEEGVAGTGEEGTGTGEEGAEEGTGEEGAEGAGDGSGEGTDDGGEGSEGEGDGEGEGSEEKGDAQKALDAKVAERATEAATAVENDFWKHIDEHVDGDVNALLDSPDYQAWIDTQPQSVRDAANQFADPTAATKVLTDYQAHAAASKDAETDLGSFLEASGLGETVVGEGDEAQPLSEFLGTEYPELGQAMMVMASTISKQAAAAALKGAGLMTADQVREMITNQGKVQELHQDSKDVLESDGYKAWLETQPPGVQAMAGSSQAADTVFVLNAYKEHSASAPTDAQKAALEKQKAAHKKRSTVQKASVGAGGGEGGAGEGSGVGDGDFASAFAEDDDDE